MYSKHNNLKQLLDSGLKTILEIKYACKYNVYMTLPYGLDHYNKELGSVFLRIQTSRSVDKKLICTIYNMSDRIISAYYANTDANVPRSFPLPGS